MLTTAQRNEFLALIQKDFAHADGWKNLKNQSKDVIFPLKVFKAICATSWSLSAALCAAVFFVVFHSTNQTLNVFVVLCALVLTIPLLFASAGCIMECYSRLMLRKDMKNPSLKIWVKDYVKRQRAEQAIKHYVQHLEDEQIALAQVHPNCNARAAKLLEDEVNRRKDLDDQNTKNAAIHNVEAMFHQEHQSLLVEHSHTECNQNVKIAAAPTNALAKFQI